MHQPIPNNPVVREFFESCDKWEAHMRRFAVLWGIDMTPPSEEDETDDLGDEWPDS